MSPTRPRAGRRIFLPLALPLLVLALVAACGGPPAADPAAAPAGATATPGVQATPTLAPAPAGALSFQIVTADSSATFRVREQLAGRELPNDAVGTSSAVSGQLVLRPDGTPVRESSRITVDLRQLQSDSGQRDRFIKSNTLSTDRFPTADFVPVRSAGLPTPLPATGEVTFRLVGPMTVRGVEREVTWDVTAQRTEAGFTGTATTSLKFGDFNLNQPRVPLVLSITDDIRLEVTLVAAQAVA